MMNKRQQGVTLIELMIVVAVIAIIASIALPAYGRYVTKAGRAEGKGALLDVAAKQEQYYLDNKSYSTTLSNLGFASNPWTTEANKYIISVDAPDGGCPIITCFELTATRTGGQQDDNECGDFTVNSSGQKGVINANLSAADCW